MIRLAQRVVEAEQLRALGRGQRSSICARRKPRQRVQVPRLRLEPLLFNRAKGGVHAVEVIGNRLDGDGIVLVVGCRLREERRLETPDDRFGGDVLVRWPQSARLGTVAKNLSALIEVELYVGPRRVIQGELELTPAHGQFVLHASVWSSSAQCTSTTSRMS